MSLADLAVCVEHDDLVTAKIFALTYKTTVTEATSYLEAYAAAHSECIVHYLLTGHPKSSPQELAYLIVDQNELSAAEAEMEVTSRSVYSLQSKPCVEYSAVAFALHEEKCFEMLALKPNYNHYLCNELGAIRVDVVVRPAGERGASTIVREATQAERKMKEVLSKPPAPTKLIPAKAVSFFAEEDKGSQVKTSDSKEAKLSKEGKEPKENKQNATAPKPKPKAFSFGPPSTKASAQPKAEEAAKEASTEEASAPVLAARGNDEAAVQAMDLAEYVVNSDDEWEDGYRPDKSNLLKMDKAFGAPEGSGGMHQPDVEEEEEGAHVVEKESKKVHVRGAIDDFISDGQDAVREDMPRKRRLVSKVHQSCMALSYSILSFACIVLC